MINSIIGNQNKFKRITLIVDLVTPLPLFLSLENGEPVLTATVFSAMLAIKVLFIFI